ncbi:queuosine precursor transporter [Candidatus Micrarchaeota archaeon]|nr:queuosine precursor transporter [Candidatus Micrarchaeota archaeon]
MDRETKFWIIVAFFVSSVIASNLMGNKIADFWGIDAGVGILIFPLSYLTMDVIQEVKGKETARKILFGALVALTFVMIVTYVSTILPSAKRDFYPLEYNKVFGVSLRVMLASLIAFVVADLSDIEIFARIKDWTSKKMLWLRATGSTVVSQFIDSTVFMFLAFYGISPKHDAFYLIMLVIPYWILKCIIAIFGTPIVYAGVKWLGEDEEVSRRNTK